MVVGDALENSLRFIGATRLRCIPVGFLSTAHLVKFNQKKNPGQQVQRDASHIDNVGHRNRRGSVATGDIQLGKAVAMILLWEKRSVAKTLWLPILIRSIKVVIFNQKKGGIWFSRNGQKAEWRVVSTTSFAYRPLNVKKKRCVFRFQFRNQENHFEWKWMAMRRFFVNLQPDG